MGILKQLDLQCTPEGLLQYTNSLYKEMDVEDKRYLDYDEFLWLYENMAADGIGLMQELRKLQLGVMAQRITLEAEFAEIHSQLRILQRRAKEVCAARATMS